MGSSSSTTTSGGSSGSSTNTNTPHQQKYYDEALGQARNLYQQGLPDYYQGQTVAGFTPAQMESMNMSSNWATGGAQDMQNNTNQQYQDMLSGQANMGSQYNGMDQGFQDSMNSMMSGQVDTGPGSPYGDMAAAYTQQATDSANQMMGDVRGNQVMSGQSGGSSRGDMLNNQVITDTNQQLSNNLAGMYGDAYSQAQDTQVAALGQYDNIMNQPLQQSQALYNQVGLPQQQLNQAIMNDQKDRYDYNANAQAQNLAQYGNFIQGDMGGIQTTNQSSSQNSTTTQG